jgi:hypothetical protein
MLGYLGSAEHLVGTRFAEVSFDIELVGSGTAGTAPGVERPDARLRLGVGHHRRDPRGLHADLHGVPVGHDLLVRRRRAAQAHGRARQRVVQD